MRVSAFVPSIPSTLDANRSASTRIWLLWDVFFIFIGPLGAGLVPFICDWLWGHLGVILSVMLRSLEMPCVSSFVPSIYQVRWVQIGAFPRIYGFSGTVFQ